MRKRGAPAKTKRGAPAAERGTLAPRPIAPIAFAATAAAAAAVALLAATIYFLTLAPSVGLVDSGELVAAAHGLGVAHPPGFPLWVLAAHLATLVPVASVAARVNASSALFAALAAGLLVFAFRAAAAASDEPRPAPARPAFALLPAALAGLLLAASRPFWAWATIAEVYALNTLLLVGVLLFVFRWRDKPERDGPLLVAAGLFGLALGVHHVSAVLLLPALAVLVGASAGAAFFRSPRLLRAAGAAAGAAALVYLYLPWAATRGAGLSWGDPDTFGRLVAHVSGRQYRSFLAPTAASFRAELGDWIATIGRAFGPIWMPLALGLVLLGLLALRRRDRPLATAIVLALAANALFAAIYSIAEDKDAYALPAVAVLALAAGFGARELVDRSGRSARPWLALSLFALPLMAVATGWRPLDRSDERIAADYVADALSTVGPDALLLTGDWQLYSPLHYFREVERLRPDVSAIDVQLLRRSWYFDFLRRHAPSLLAATAPEVDAYLAELRHWERDPKLFERDATLRKRINDRYLAMILALVEHAKASGPVYVTADLVVRRMASDPSIVTLLAERWPTVPQGIVFELRSDARFVDPAPVAAGRPLRTPGGLFDPSRALDPKGVAALKVRPVYLTMLGSRAAYLAAHGFTKEARSAFTELLAIDPAYEPAKRALATLPAP